MTSNPSLSWQEIQDVYYSLRSCYDTLNWSIGNLHSDHKVKISSNSTLVALSSKHAKYPSLIEIYSISGNKLWSIIFNSTPTEHIIDYEFRGEDLYVVLSNQKIRHYRDLKGNFNEYSYTDKLIKLDDFGDSNILLPKNEEFKTITNLESNDIEEIYKVEEIYNWGPYLFLRLTNRFIITDLNTWKNYEIPISDQLSDKIHCMSLVTISNDDKEILTVICFNNTVISLKVDLNSSSYEFIDYGLTDGPFNKVAVSPNGQLIALLNSELSTIFVINNTFNQVLLEYDTSNDSSLPYQIQWCSNDALVLALRDEIKLLGPNQASISFFYDVLEEDFDFDSVLKNNGVDELSFTIPILKSEVDGLKILTTNKLEFLSRVPIENVNLYQIGSSHPSSILLDSIDKLSLHSSKADANISLLKSDHSLLLAIDESLKAALYEFNPFWQKKILSSVSFGKTYCDQSFNGEEYVKVVNLLKVLNQLRSSEIAIFLTSNEVETIGWSSIIDMLLKRDEYLLSIKIIDLLGLNHLKDKIYINWCCYKIKKEIDLEDHELFKIISKKLKSARNNLPFNEDTNYISISEISEIAYEEGRIDLCKLLIDLEPSMNKKIQQYINFEELELGLIKSFQSNEYDLCKLILLYLYDTLSISQFFKILHQNEQKSDTISGDAVEHFWIEIIGKNESTSALLEKYYKQEDMKMDLTILKFKTFLKQFNEDLIKETVDDDFYDNYKSQLKNLSGFSGDRRNSKYYQLELEILEAKKRLSDTYQVDFFKYKSLNDIITKLIQMNQLKQCQKLTKEFKIPQEKFWFILIETYASTGEFERLHQFILSTSADKHNLKSPISFQNIVDTCLAYNGPSENISIYIDNCKDIHYSEKIQMYIKNNDLVSAANESYYYKDIEFLRSILERANKLANDSTIESIKSLINKLGY
ncbi:vacuolar protein sorting-associated protein 16 [[Candida] jaroonii]|uniref:Vacuolar protein sorting-associated protein 16 n=1 Tax=[Candida] jaroonii TaxID=467808 RepID=A0ACA9Y5U8_9ASCO|nr:vacuolar protein sorting-associated protein 16 [[Candida] jaroonii]